MRAEKRTEAVPAATAAKNIPPKSHAHAQNMTGAKTVLHPKTACTLSLTIATYFLLVVEVVRVFVEVVTVVVVVDVVAVVAVVEVVVAF